MPGKNSNNEISAASLNQLAVISGDLPPNVRLDGRFSHNHQKIKNEVVK
jgi:hypothetical protein